jgi:predicted nuclease of predicted toxin-antitoxin system
VILLLDENLSPRLVAPLVSLFPGLTHVREIGLAQASDEQIWEWAKVNGATVVTADADFVMLSRSLGWPPKVIHIEQCDFPLRVIDELLHSFTAWQSPLRWGAPVTHDSLTQLVSTALEGDGGGR